MAIDVWGDEIVRLTKIQRHWLNVLSAYNRDDPDDAPDIQGRFSVMPPATYKSLRKRGYVDSHGLTGEGYDALAQYV